MRSAVDESGPLESAKARGDGLFADLVLVALSAAGIALIGFLLGRDGPARIAADEPGAVGRLALSSGTRRRAAGSLVWDDVRAPIRLAAGDALYVAPGGSARVALDSGAVLEVEERSMIVLEPATTPTPRLELVRGAVSSVVRGTRLAVRTKSSELVLGTGADARVVAAEAGPAVELYAGQASIGSRRIEPEPPSPLLAPPRNHRHWLGSGASPLELRWEAAAGRGLEVEVARDREFRVVVARAPGEAGALRFEPAAPGAYFWRLAAGRTPRSEIRAISVMRDVPPAPISPPPGEIVFAGPGETVPFAWTQVDGAEAYQIEIAEEGDPTFQRIVATSRSDASHAWIPLDVAEGTYLWRVVASGPDRPDSPPSQPSAFRVAHRPLPDAPKLLDPVLEVERGAR